ncbi:protein TBATA [Cavia porcellus]|uniref:protein TBATA n=1 Tax=Cavia porcellus TaxID=10141 RepID=UPI002FE19B22
MATEVRTQLAEHPLKNPKATLKPKKSGHSRLQKEPAIPGNVDLEGIQEELRAPRPQIAGAYRFGHLSNHSFFSRHHPHPQRVTHIQGLSGKPICVVRDEFSLISLPQFTPLTHSPMGMPTTSVPIGDPRSNRNPQLPSEAWKRELKKLTSRVAVFTKETELKNKEVGAEPGRSLGIEEADSVLCKEVPRSSSVGPTKRLSVRQKEEPQRDQRAKYSTKSGRLISTSTEALSHHSVRQSQRSRPSSIARGTQASLLQDQELQTLELLCQILQTDSLSAIQFWLLYAPPQEKDLALGLLQTAVAQLLQVQEPPLEKLQAYSQSHKKTKSPLLPKSERPVYIGKAQVLQVHFGKDPEENTSKPKAES